VKANTVEIAGEALKSRPSASSVFPPICSPLFPPLAKGGLGGVVPAPPYGPDVSRSAETLPRIAVGAQTKCHIMIIS
jgi:hypothetical protein